MYYTKLMFYGFLILLCRETTTIDHDIYKKEVYCGKKLVNILSQFCLELPTYHHHTGVVVLSRHTRQVVKECCKNKCSLSYLLENYCEKVNTAALDAFVNIGDIKLTNGQLDHPNLITPSPLFTTNKRQRRRRKRNCKCREVLNRTRVLNEELPETPRDQYVPEPEIGEVEVLQSPFYVF